MKSFVALRISGNELNTNIISEELGIIPHYTQKKGNPITSKYTNEIVGHYEEDCWIYEIESNCKDTTEMCLERLFLTILPHSKYLKNLSAKHNVTIWVSIYPDNEQNNLHLSENILKVICEMGATLEISTLFLESLY